MLGYLLAVLACITARACPASRRGPGGCGGPAEADQCSLETTI